MDKTITCPDCGATGHIKDFDIHEKGAWCPICNTFIWNNPEDNHQHTSLILEQKTSSADAEEVNLVSSIKLNRHLSPLRYPGGKTKIINYLITKLQTNKCDTFVEVFAGGASFGLALLDAGIIKQLIINDIDKNLIAFWNEVINNKETLINKLQTIKPNREDYNQAKELLISNASVSSSELAWAYLLVNRLSYSGIQKAGCLGGKNGTNEALLSRYNPDKLIKRINRIAEMKDNITILNEDFKKCIETYYWDDKATLFIDPPYYGKGKKLYTHYFTLEDHCTLSELITSLVTEFPDAADILITYDNSDTIKDLYEPHIPPTEITRKYSI